MDKRNFLKKHRAIIVIICVLCIIAAILVITRYPKKRSIVADEYTVIPIDQTSVLPNQVSRPTSPEDNCTTIKQEILKRGMHLWVVRHDEKSYTWMSPDGKVWELVE